MGTKTSSDLALPLRNGAGFSLGDGSRKELVYKNAVAVETMRASRIGY